jgi:hypothetical protein
MSVFRVEGFLYPNWIFREGMRQEEKKARKNDELKAS